MHQKLYHRPGRFRQTNCGTHRDLITKVGFYRVTPCPRLPSLVDICFHIRQLSCLQNDRQNDHMTSALLVAVTTKHSEAANLCRRVNLNQKWSEKRGWWLVNVWEMLINLLKSPILQWWGKWKSDLESVSRTGSSSTVNQVLPIIIPSYNEVSWLLLQ